MPGFRVELDALVALGQQLDDARTLLGGALTALDEVAAASLGTEELDGACAEFRRSWSHGLGKLEECVAAVGEGITASRAVYAATEAAVRRGFEGTP